MSASGPLTDAEVLARYRDQAWRLQNLYWIITKGDDDEDAVVQFRPNLAQRRLLRQLHNRNVVPKARQLGITTLVAILWLDTALFADAPLRCGIVAHDKESAEIIFRDKIGFAYDRLPDVLKAMFPVAERNRSEIVFAHNRASVRVATSVRGGTLHRLHVSELGKISAKYPAKAREVITGSIPAVPKSGVLVIESTAEGAEGPFHDITMSALALQQSNRALTPLDYRLHFFAWWGAPEYTLPANSVVLDDGDRKYFRDLEVLHNITISDDQKAWYAATLRSLFQGDRALMWQEYPSYCVCGDALVATPSGSVPLRDVVPDGQVITRHMRRGIKPTFKIVTRLGYTVTCTSDHRVKLATGEFMTLDDGLAIGARLQLAPLTLGNETQVVEVPAVPFARSEVAITSEFAEFLGVFMGDGSFHNGTVSVACDAQDGDMVHAVEGMFEKFLGGAYSRATGSKKGCVEVRKASVGFTEPMMALGIVERRDGGAGYKRKVNVPPYIFKSPPEVAAAFLRGLFEADGFVSREGSSSKFFSKHEHVARDVQRLLLALGIESRVSSSNKTKNGYTYIGWELALRANGVRKFAQQVGFISRRKQARAELSLTKRATGAAVTFDWTDEIASIEPAGDREVFDITTATHEFCAGGVVVHNCEEAFKTSAEGCYYTQQLADARKQGRIAQTLPLEVGVPVNSFWDIGLNDNMAIWLHQRVGLQNRFIRFYKNSGETLAHYAQWLLGQGVVYGTHYLPHDAAYKRPGTNPDTNESIEDMLRTLMPGHRFEIVPRVTSVLAGIQATRQAFASCWIDESACSEGLADLGKYRKQWDDRRGTWKDQPFHGPESDSADAFRQFGQVAQAGGTFATAVAKAGPGKTGFVRRRGSAMAV